MGKALRYYFNFDLLKDIDMGDVKMNKIFCDKCGREVVTKLWNGKPRKVFIDNNDGTDLCHTCFNKLCKYFKNLRP